MLDQSLTSPYLDRASSALVNLHVHLLQRNDGSGDRRCWVTFEGEVWHPLAPDYQMAVSAVMGAAKSAGVLVLDHPGMAQPSGDHSEAVALPLVAQMLAAPNPFNPQTDIRFTLPQGGRVELAIYDIRGRLVRRLHGGELAAGEHTVSWDGRDRHGRTQPSGVYVARLQAGSLQLSSRLTLVQ